MQLRSGTTSYSLDGVILAAPGKSMRDSQMFYGYICVLTKLQDIEYVNINNMHAGFPLLVVTVSVGFRHDDYGTKK